MNLQAVGKSAQPFADGPEHGTRQTQLGVLAQKIRPAQGTDEEEVTAQQNLGHLARARRVVNQEGEMLGGVAGCVQSPDSSAAQLDDLAIVHILMCELYLVGFAPIAAGNVQAGAGSFRKFASARGEVGVDVCLQYPRDLEALRLGVVEVDVHIAPRVHHGELTGRPAPDDVRVVCQASVLEPFEQHQLPPFPATFEPLPAESGLAASANPRPGVRPVETQLAAAGACCWM